jgi:hypothetical protein
VRVLSEATGVATGTSMLKRVAFRAISSTRCLMTQHQQSDASVTILQHFAVKVLPVCSF